MDRLEEINARRDVEMMGGHAAVLDRLNEQYQETAKCRQQNERLMNQIAELTAERDAEKRRADAAEGKIQSIHTILDCADRLHSMAKDAIELSVSNGLALGKIALTVGHEYKSGPEPGRTVSKTERVAKAKC